METNALIAQLQEITKQSLEKQKKKARAEASSNKGERDMQDRIAADAICENIDLELLAVARSGNKSLDVVSANSNNSGKLAGVSKYVFKKLKQKGFPLSITSVIGDDGMGGDMLIGYNITIFW